MMENGHQELLKELSDLLIDGSNDLNDISETLTLMALPQARVLQKAVEDVSEKLLQGNLWILGEAYAPDERKEYLDNLQGYFNEETGTWYEQICQNYTTLTGFGANKWDALMWTIHLSLGYSTFDYLVHQNLIYLRGDGKWHPLHLDRAETPERVLHLVDTDFEELR